MKLMRDTQCVVMLLLGVFNVLFAQNNCLEFDGTDDYVDCGVTSPAWSNSAMTIELWLQSSTIDANPDVCLGWGNSDIYNHSNIQFRIVSGKLQFGLHPYGGDWNSCQSSAVVCNGNWNHVAVVKNETNYQMYINGIADGSFTSSNMMSVDRMTIANYYEGMNSNFKGQIDEVRIWNDARTQSEIRRNMYRELPNPTGETNLVAYYKFNESSGTTLTDSKGSNNGTLTNMDNLDWQTSSAMFGPKNCLDFDGSSDFVNINLSPGIIANSLTEELWIKFDNLGSQYNLSYLNSESSPDERIVPYKDASDKINLYIYDNDTGTQTIVETNYAVEQNVWYHLVFVYYNRDAKIYINGKLHGSDSNTCDFSFPTENLNLLIGSDNGGFYSDIHVDEFRIWNDARSASEIRENMCKTLTGNESGLVAYYTFDNTSGTTLQDFSENGNDGALQNMDDSDWAASAAFTTWLNTSSSSWSSAANWSLAGAPAATDNVGIYDYTGSAPVLSGTPTINNCVVGPASDLTLGSTASINGNLFLFDELDLNGHFIELGSSAQIYEETGSLAYGTDGTLTAVRTLSAVTAENVAGLGAEITTAADMGSTTITRGHAVQSINGAGGIKRYYDITPANNSGLNATLVFHYDDSELNSLNESTLTAYKSTDSGGSWSSVVGVVNTTANTYTVTGLDGFSRWTLGEEPPVAVKPSSFSAVISESSICLSWKTACESGVAGFRLLRSEKEDGVFANISPELIVSLGSPTTGADYSFTDIPPIPEDYFYKLQTVNLDGSVEVNGPVKATFQTQIVDNAVVEEFNLYQNYPNPFNPSTRISYSLAHDDHVVISVFDILGNFVTTLVDGHEKAGRHSILWNATRANGDRLAGGVYFVTMKSSEQEFRRKITLVK